MGRFGRGNYRSIGDQREMDARVGDEIGLELVEVDIERAIEAEGSRDRGHDYCSL